MSWSIFVFNGLSLWGGCSFCWYWWNCWPSPFKLSFYNRCTCIFSGPSWPWSYGSWIYNYLCNQCLSPLMLWLRISIRARCTTKCCKVSQWLATGRWLSPPIKLTASILLKVALNTIKQTNSTLCTCVDSKAH